GVHTFGVSVALAVGPRPATEALATLDTLLPEQPYPGDLMVRALLLMMVGRTEEAWTVGRAADEHARELGNTSESNWMAELALIAGDLPAAAAYLEASSEALKEIGVIGPLTTTNARFAKVLCMLGRHDEGETLAAETAR